ncbi:hypothetical protein N9005_05565, partial [Akkermansiaceae bacterium]|nr:hypothetical protein [Akkermansiaceae bacterium]
GEEEDSWLVFAKISLHILKRDAFGLRDHQAYPNKGQSNRLLFGKTDTNPSYFLIDSETVQRLSAGLLEE